MPSMQCKTSHTREHRVPYCGRSILGRVFGLILAIASLGSLAPPDVAIKASPQWGFNLSTRITLTVEPHPDNRNLCWSYDSGEVYSSSCWKLAGADAPRTTTKVVEYLKQGVYVVAIEVLRADGTRKVATTKICSLGDDVGMDQCNPSIQ